MTIDKAKLKALAETGAASGNWMECPATDVLALLAEIERLIPFEEAYATACHVRNRLIRENEALRKDAERYRGVRRVANRQGITDEQFDQQTDTRVANFDEAMAKEASRD